MIDPVLLNLLPPLRRARGDRLYGPDQKHWVDLWKQDGAWLLGRRPEGAAKEWKNQIDKGLGGWAPSLWPRRLENLTKTLWPGAAVRVFRNVDRAPAVPVWRPWEEAAVADPAPGAFRLVLPTGPGQAVAVAFTPAWKGSIPDHDVTSPAEAAALVRAMAEVLRFSSDPRAIEARKTVCSEFDRHLGPSGVFQRRGIWLTGPGVDYANFFRRHLQGGFVLNPDPHAPSVLPQTLSHGEWTAWKAVVEAWSPGRS